MSFLVPKIPILSNYQNEVWAVSEFDCLENTEIEKVFDSKEKAFTFIKSMASEDTTISKWDEQPGGGLVLLAQTKFRVNQTRSVYHDWKVQVWPVE
jgi:hypothetical protein